MTAPSIILSRPQLGENIGAAARAMANFGLSDLRLVAPRDGWPNEKASHMAVGAKFVLDKVRVFDTLESALGDLHYVYATSARDRGTTKEVVTPPEAALRLRKASARGEKTGILFGNERAGLDNDEVSLADAVITVPTSDFTSLNLGQTVMIAAYEWFRAADATPPARIEHSVWHRKPTREELFGLLDHLERELADSGFLYPPAKYDSVVRSMRATVHRAKLTYQEVQTIRGMIVALVKNKHRVKKE